jgi:hypothetical protein
MYTQVCAFSIPPCPPPTKEMTDERRAQLNIELLRYPARIGRRSCRCKYLVAHEDVNEICAVHPAKLRTHYTRVLHLPQPLLDMLCY